MSVSRTKWVRTDSAAPPGFAGSLLDPGQRPGLQVGGELGPGGQVQARRSSLEQRCGRAQFRHFPLALIAGFQVRLETLEFVRIEGSEYPSGDVRVRNARVSH
jgi:hypothetical protein